jgi:hypothetical protein
MSEHKLKEGSNGDERVPLSSHIVESVHCGTDDVGPEVEAAYGRLNARAKADDSVILGVVQGISTFVLQGEWGRALIVLTAQRIGREDLERAQRQSVIQGGRR